MNVSFSNRLQYTRTTVPDVDFEVQNYSWSAFGGPKLATIKAYGDDISLWRLIEMIRYGTEITADEGDAVWWGNVAEVRAQIRSLDAIARGTQERVRVGITVDSMANYLYVAYTQIDITATPPTLTRATAGPFFDTESLNAFGTVELLWTKDSASSEHANAAGSAYLAQHKEPRAVVSPAGGASVSEATIICRGWWDTIGDRLYNNSGTATLDTATQAGTIISLTSQHITGVDVEDTSGIAVTQYRDGDSTALFEVLQLLEMGTNNFRRLLATVDINRRVRIYEEPANTSVIHYMRANGDVYQRDEKIRSTTCPVAIWVKASDVVPAPIDSNILGDASLIFIEESEYNVKEKTLKITPRGALDPWDFPRIKDG